MVSTIASVRAAGVTRARIEGTRSDSPNLPQPLRDEISHFYSIYKQPEGKHVMVDGWFSREEALATIEAARRRRAELA